MSPAVSTAALIVPTVAAQAIFSSRRAKNGFDNLDDNTVFALMNFDIAAGQLLKGTRAARTLMNQDDKGALDKIKGNVNIAEQAEKSKKASLLTKFKNGSKKVLDFTAYHINPIIWCAGITKALLSDKDDKPTALYEELVPIGTMRLFEEGYSAFLGMPITKKDANGVQVNIKREGYINKLFKKEGLSAIEDASHIKKGLMSAGKGLGFVAASIAGYKLGELIVEETL